jgi:DNA/RNA endonuclease YhcR with UshA esterase domain
MPACPSCGRDPGPNDICPHCGADLKRRLRIRTFGLAAIVMAIVGLGLLWLFATHQPIARVKIADVQTTSNYAYVQIDGVVTRGPNYNPDSQSLTWWVRDDSGELLASSFRATTQDLITADKVPAPGDRISLQGTLRVRDTVPSLTLDSAQSLVIERAAASALPRDIGSITLDDALRGVMVRGVVRSIQLPFDGLKLITLRDATGAIDVAISTDLETLLGATPAITLGQSVQALGAVTLYSADPQITLRRGADLTPLTEPVALAQKSAVGDLSESSAGKWVRVAGTIERVAPFSAGVKLTLSDNTGQVTVLFWQNVWDALTAGPVLQSDILPGATMSVQGELSLYRGDLEIAPELPLDVRLLQPPSPPPTPPPPTVPPPAALTLTPTATAMAATPALTKPASTSTSEATASPAISANAVSIKALTKDKVGQPVAVRGKVVEAASFSAGFKFLIDDGTGRVNLTLFEDNYKFVPNRAGLNLGADIHIVAELAEYQGVLELQPKSGRDVTILSPGSSAGVPLTTINQLGKPGQFVAIEGRITDVRPFSAGLNVFVDDGTGNVRVTLFNNVLAYVPNRTGLVADAQVRVVGKTDFFGRVEVVPALGYDVTIK